MSQRENDARFMRAALSLGRRGMGRTAPNPAVGALIVRDGIVFGRGVTAPGGRPHAEPIAIAAAGEGCRGATLYVTLEPCSHHGHTPPCVEAVLGSGIERVVVAIEDPDPRVAGRGIAQMRAAGLEVVVGVEAAEAAQDHKGHIRRVTHGRPAVTLKMAETADGFAARAPGQERLLITGPQANAIVHRMRALHDAIMIGRGTAVEDDPLLTVRLPGMEHLSPLRILVDRTASLSPNSRLARSAREVPVILVTSRHSGRARGAELARCGVDLLELDDPHDLQAVLAALSERGVTRVLCEGGPTVASALLDRDLVDDVVLLTGSHTLNGTGRPALTREACSRLFDPDSFRLEEDTFLGTDRVRAFTRQ